MSDSGLTGKDAMRAAARRGNETQRKRSLATYAADPKFCAHCNKQLGYDKRKNRFCDHSCAASANNLGVRRHGKFIRKQCIKCGTITKNTKYCSDKCVRDYEWEQKKIIATRIGRFETHHAAKRYLLEIYGNICFVCGLSEWNNQQIPICIDHINGNYADHNISNVRLICPNCDAQTDTYKGRNRGNGRHSRRERYQKGLSY